MSLVAVPDDGELNLCGIRTPGRQLRAATGVPVARVTDWTLGSGMLWASLAQKSARSGLQPFLLYGEVFGPVGPRETGERFDEQVSEPEDTHPHWENGRVVTSGRKRRL